MKVVTHGKRDIASVVSYVKDIKMEISDGPSVLLSSDKGEARGWSQERR